MNAIQKAIQEVKSTIPRRILEAAFLNRYRDWRHTDQTTIEHQIEQLVIRPRVIVDCDLAGGTQTNINLDGLPVMQLDISGWVVRIPKDRTQGRSIVTPIHVNYLSMAANYQSGVYTTSTDYDMSNPGENSALMRGASALVSSKEMIPIVSSANVRLIAENTVLVRERMFVTSAAQLLCILGNDDQMSNIAPSSYPYFSQLVKHAAKAYIYNTLIIDIGDAELQGGAALGVFKTVIDGYADSEQNYQDYLEQVWSKVAFMNDQDTYARLIKSVVGGYR